MPRRSRPSGNFRIKIDGEILIVTGVAGNTFTITRGAEGTTAATHANGASVIHLLTKGGLEARVANRFISDIYDNKPAAGVKGRLFLPTDGLFLEYDDGAAWHKYGPFKRLKAPPQTGWSWVNQGNATVTYSDGRLVLEDPDLDGTDPELRLYVRPAPQWPAALTMAFLFNGIGDDTPRMGFCFRQTGGGAGDGNIHTFGVYLGTSRWAIERNVYSSPTVKSTGGGWDTTRSPERLLWFRFQVVGDKKQVYYSMDGVNWVLGYETTLTSYATPNQVGLYIDPQANAQPVSLSLVHWEEG